MRNLTDIEVDANSQVLLEMATCGVEHWGKNQYKIAVHGAATKDRPIPHIHIYMDKDVYPYTKFNFEISFIDLICKNEINLIHQIDRAKNLKKTNRTSCSWTGYGDILTGFRKFLFEPYKNSGFENFSDNLEHIIYEWNKETDYLKTENGGNPLKDYLDEHGLTIHANYVKYFENK